MKMTKLVERKKKKISQTIKKHVFVNNIDMTVVHNVVHTLNSSDIDSQDDIDEVVNSLGHVFIDWTNTTFGIYN